MNYRQGTTADIDKVLKLQQKYLLTNTPEDLRSEGFVTTPFSVEQLKEIIAFEGLFVAETNNEIIAYIVVCSWDFFCRWPIFSYMSSRFNNLSYGTYKINTEQTFEYGPICIDKAYRNSDVLPSIFETMRKAMNKRFSVGVTFINKLNKRSFAAHTKKLHLTVIDEFSFNEHNYYTLAFETGKSLTREGIDMG